VSEFGEPGGGRHHQGRPGLPGGPRHRRAPLLSGVVGLQRRSSRDPPDHPGASGEPVPDRCRAGRDAAADV